MFCRTARSQDQVKYIWRNLETSLDVNTNTWLLLMEIKQTFLISNLPVQLIPRSIHLLRPVFVSKLSLDSYHQGERSCPLVMLFTLILFLVWMRWRNKMLWHSRMGVSKEKQTNICWVKEIFSDVHMIRCWSWMENSKVLWISMCPVLLGGETSIFRHLNSTMVIVDI